MRIGLASDQLGFEHTERLKAGVIRQGNTAEDLSTEQAGAYRAITDQLASAIRRGCLERGVLICSGAIGASVLANKQRAVRAALCHDFVVAFENQAHFTTVFGNLVGMTPRQFQRFIGARFGPSLPPVTIGCGVLLTYAGVCD